MVFARNTLGQLGADVGDADLLVATSPVFKLTLGAAIRDNFAL
jgi:hypothetical protein